MKDWNVIVTVDDTEGFHAARRSLRAFGSVVSTDFHNVLAMRVPDVQGFLEALDARIAVDKSLLNDVSRILPAQVSFDFATPDEFKAKARAAVLQWAPRLTGQRFHVRLNRRGHRADLPSVEVERLLDDAVLAKTDELGGRAHVAFSDPDYVIDVETIGERAGLSLWSREDLRRFPFLRID
jgi:tRNA(Ser,Leu) C12 N-acetylase TAN1